MCPEMCAQLWDCGLSSVVLYIFEVELRPMVYTLSPVYSDLCGMDLRKYDRWEIDGCFFPCRLAVVFTC